jgi:hypothetical protein
MSAIASNYFFISPQRREEHKELKNQPRIDQPSREAMAGKLQDVRRLETAP